MIRKKRKLREKLGFITFNRLFRKKTIDIPQPDNTAKHHLKKVLGTTDLIMIGLGATIGTGIFVISGVASSIAGPGIIVSFLIASVCCLSVALCYAELASVIPLTGSAYSYTYTIFGEIFAWIIGWAMLLELTIALAVVASGWSQYIIIVLNNMGIVLPRACIQDPCNGGIIDLLAVAIVFMIMALLLQGIKESARVNSLLVLIKIVVLGIFFWFGSQAINMTNYIPFFPSGIHGILTGAGLIIVSYIGFELIATSAEEVKNPRKHLPAGLIGTIGISTVFYIITGLILTGVVPYTFYRDVSAPISFALTHAGYPMVGGLIAAGALIGITSGLLVFIYGSSRIVFALSRDGLLPSALSKINKNGVPFLATIAVSSIGAILSGLTPIELLAELLNMGTLVAFISVAAGVLFLRRSNPDLIRPFRCPFVPFFPLLAIFTSIALIASLQAITLLGFIIWMFFGLAVYGIYGIKRSRLENSNWQELH